MEKEKVLAHLQSLTEQGLPEILVELDDDSLNAVEDLVAGILEKERAGLDSLFSSMTHTMKFIPNLLLQTLTSKYIEPPIAARITAKLTTKQAVAIANGLKPEYVAETNRYMEGHHAAELLEKMNTKKAKQALLYCIENYPSKALDVMECLEDSVLSNLASRSALKGMSGEFDIERRDRLIELF